MNSDMIQIISLVCTVLCFIIAIVFHEVAHGFVAYKLGDPTAKRAGRLSLNPIKHIDPFGTIILPICLMLMNCPVFGYAKPVPYNPTYFKDIRKGDFLVGIAGPLANLVIALIATGCYYLLGLYTSGIQVADATPFDYFLVLFRGQFLLQLVLLNLVFMFFNLLPIPPLDGSSIIALFIPIKHLPKWYQLQRWALPIFMVLVILVPYFLNFNPVSMYINVTAGNLFNLLIQ